MAFELAAYGLVSGVLWHKVKHTVPYDVRFSCHRHGGRPFGLGCGTLCAGRPDRFVSFPFSAFLSGALLTAVPGIVAQLVLIPLILIALQKAKFMD